MQKKTKKSSTKSSQRQAARSSTRRTKRAEKVTATFTTAEETYTGRGADSFEAVEVLAETMREAFKENPVKTKGVLRLQHGAREVEKLVMPYQARQFVTSEVPRIIFAKMLA